MAKKRIHQLAKELEVASADILFKSNELGIEVKTASSGLTPEEEELIKLAFEDDNSALKEETHDDAQDEKVSTSEEKNNEDIQLDKEENEINIIEITEGSTPEDISEIIEIDATQIVTDLMSLGIMQSITSNLSNEEIEKLLEKYSYIPEFVKKIEIKRSEIIDEITFEDDEQKLKKRAPIITVMDMLIMEKQVY